MEELIEYLEKHRYATKEDNLFLGVTIKGAAPDRDRDHVINAFKGSDLPFTLIEIEEKDLQAVAKEIREKDIIITLLADTIITDAV